MENNSRQKLADYLRALMRAQYGSVSAAARQEGIHESTIRQALNRNRFNTPFLKIFFSDTTMEQLQDLYEFVVTRKNGKDSLPAPAPHALSFLGLDQEDVGLIQENKVLRDRIARFAHDECERLREFLHA